MKKVVVFDSGWGGELVADFIEEELAVVDVVRVIDWRNAPYIGKSNTELLSCVESALAPYWGRADAIVLGGFVVSSLRHELQRRHLEENFVALDFTNLKTRMQKLKRILFLADKEITEGDSCQKLMAKMTGAGKETVVVDCRGWTKLIDDGEMTADLLRNQLEPINLATIDIVVIGNTHFWDVEEDLRSGLRWQAIIYDYRHELINDLCGALGFQGRSGWRAKC